MSEAAVRRMALDEFLRWDDGSDTRYELIDGFPVAMAPPARTHRNAQIEAGILRPDRAASYYVADIAVTCAANERGRQAIVDPVLIVEILSPGAERHDRRTKLPVYRQIESVREVLLLDADCHYAELHRRDNDRWIVEIARGKEAAVFLASVDLEMTLADVES
jgi:Uma2 family endonuclease